MPSKLAEQKSQLLEKTATTLKERLSGKSAALAEEFARQFYSRVAPEDMLEYDPDDVYGMVLSLWNFARKRKAGTPSIRVYNPTFEAHGWQSTHTVVEIVTEDMPFLVDSIAMEINRHNLTVHRIIHPVVRVVRDNKGQITGILESNAKNNGETPEATMHFEVNRQTDPTLLNALENDLDRIIGDVREAVEDWQAMRARMREIIAGLDPKHLPVPKEEVDEVRALLEWVEDDHFTFLGCRTHDLVEKDGNILLQGEPNSGLGILRDDQTEQVSQSFAELTADQRALALKPTLLVITKANARSTVHRPAHLDYLGIKRFDKKGKVVGEWRFLGLFTSVAYSTSPQHIPLLRSKVKEVLERANLSRSGHAGKALQNILDNFPRDELFQATVEEIFEISMGILHLQERQRLRLFVREDPFGRFVSCIVYVPRERHTTELRIRMQNILMEAFSGTSSEFRVEFSESVLARVLFHILTPPANVPEYSTQELEERLYEAMLSWQDHLQRVLLEQCGEERGNKLFERYSDAFPAAYREDYTARTAVSDILHLEKVGPDNPLEMRLYRPLEDPEGMLRFKVFGPLQPIPLSDVLPMLERLGLRVLTARPYEIAPRDDEMLWVLDFDMIEADGLHVDATQVHEIFQDAFAQVWSNRMESDGFNRLILAAQLRWQDVAMLRAYCKYLLQTRVTFSQAYMEQTLANHTNIAQLLVDLFHARFDPKLLGDQGRKTTALGVAIEEALEKVSSLDEDRILRRFHAIIEATLRTNFFQTDDAGVAKDYLSFKFDPSRIPELPLPRPMFEIFVYSPRVEAIHLRGGPVARGGLRWSDRREDFRTEVLGLMKAQMVKNAVIVPVGSKGGFVVKRPPLGGREALQEEVVFCYKTFIRGMLDITDNLVDQNVIAPRQVVRHDKDDPYLVVAADKGTATFSDIANGIAADYGFWLGDAFASGGSVGYDHKKMGITARGAWESVKRHFREMGMDIQERDDFSVVGIGDMGGDVFGNGMLLSRHIKLLAAFNHMHIFLDPDPDPETSYRERERLFQLPRSSWEDYNADLISKGGGVFARSAKSIPISPEARAALDIDADQLTPIELMTQLLKAPVDLIWNGGIGTYVKAKSETHADVGDRANDALRINGGELRCKAVGEGGNLGLTQLGRIEYALKGGRVFTDAIDNSGGVNCSDHEVNIKILLNQVVVKGDMTEKQRNDLLVRMTDEVAELVLRQNYLQPEALQITAAKAVDLLGDHARMIRNLERVGKLNRAIEYLPSDEEIAEREAAHRGLVAPELAVLLAYSKITVFEELIASDVPEDRYLRNELVAYFPEPLRKDYVKEMDAHPLRREIIATYITNSMQNRMGSTFVFRLRDETGETAPNIARAYSAAREMFDGRRLWSEIDTLDNTVAADVQIRMHLDVRNLLERATLWLLRNRRPPLDVETIVNHFAGGIGNLFTTIPQLLPPTESEAAQNGRQRLVDAAVPEDLAEWVASLDLMYSALDLIEVAVGTHLPPETVASVYFALGSELELSWLRDSITTLPVHNHWQYKARAALLNGLYDQQRHLTAELLRLTEAAKSPSERVQSWLDRNRGGVDRCQALFADLRGSGQPDLAMLSVALRQLADLSEMGGIDAGATAGDEPVAVAAG